MKKLLLVAVTLMVSNMAFAQDCRWGIDHRHPSCGPRWHYEHRPATVIYRDNDNWIAPLIIGGIAVKPAMPFTKPPTRTIFWI